MNLFWLIQEIMLPQNNEDARFKDSGKKKHGLLYLWINLQFKYQ